MPLSKPTVLKHRGIWHVVSYMRRYSGLGDSYGSHEQEQFNSWGDAIKAAVGLGWKGYR